MNRLRFRLPLLLGLTAALALAAMLAAEPARAQSDRAKARHWRVIAIIPEQHLEQRRIPDPAAETALCKQLIDAGYKVIDQDRYRELRYSAQIDRIVKGGPNAAKEAMLIGRKFGADIFVTGEAFTQEALRKTVLTELGDVQRIQCRGRLELRAMRVDTGERIYADALHKTGSPEATVELASKICLQQLGDELSETLLKKLDGLSLSSAQRVELEVRGVPSVSLANALEKALAGLTGVQEVSPGAYEAHIYEAEVLLDKHTLRDFAARLESAPTLKRFGLTVRSASGSRIVAECRWGR